MAYGRRNRGAGFWLHAGLALIGSIFVAAIGAVLAWQGFELVRVGGSWYYLLAGLGLIASGGLLATRRTAGGLVFMVVFLATIAWGVWEAGVNFWPLLPRIFAPAVIGVVVMLVLLSQTKDGMRRMAMQGTGLGVILSLLLLGVGVVRTFSDGQAKADTAKIAAAPPVPTGAAADWRYYGRQPDGTRFAPFQQINRDNVGQLQEAWRIRTGDIADRGSEDQNTPSVIGDTVYVCTPTNIVIALDGDTGKEKWRHDPKAKRGFWNRCRGVGYHEQVAAATPVSAPAAVTPATVTPAATTTPAAATAAPAAPGLCAKRIISSTIDARLIALDAATGQRCPGFGVGGEVDLKADMGEVKKGFYFQTSMPTVINDVVVIGGWVQDNTELGEPSGVVRAFSALTGELVWAWDLGNPAITKLPPEGQGYTRGTPNVWSTPAFDPALNLIYLPTGNATPDYWGSHRSDIAEEYSASIVALDVATGRERWKFQTVHHDVWDYDVPAQPMLVDFPDGKGGTTPALIQLTKRGQTFVLDRRTGAPITKVEERPVPQGAAPGEWLAPTQPYSVEMPVFGGEKITERMMWGVTPIDQAMCRVAFKKLRYEGEFTPPGTTPSLQYHGNGGGQNWHSGALDAKRNYLITTGLRNPITVVLKKTDKPTNQPTMVPNRSAKGANMVPYQSSNEQFLSKIGVPCLAPPHGMMMAIDLNTRQVAWQVPIGTAETSGPFGIQSGLKIPIGGFGIGGMTATAGDLVFHAATQDPYLRAYDTATGKIVWKARLPVGSGGTPSIYVSPKTGRQYVVLTVGGARRMPARGDYVIAYALPEGR